MKEQREYTLENELAIALFKFSYGRLSVTEAKETAKKVLPNYDTSNEMLMHKGLDWYAKQLLAVM